MALITCPSYSILFPLTKVYIPNEKLAIGLVLIYALFNARKFQMDKDALLLFGTGFIIILAITLFKFFFYSAKIVSYVDFHYISVLFYMPFYISFFKSRKGHILRALKTILWMHLSVAMFQWVCIIFKNRELSKIFNNYPYQENYFFESFFGFVRVSGLFFESSQLAIFFLIAAAYFKHFSRKWFFVMIICALSTYSFTGFLGVFFIVCYMVVKGEIKVHYVVMVGLFAMFFLANLFGRFISLLDVIFSASASASLANDDSFNRLSSFNNKMKFLFSNAEYAWIGYANTFDFPSFDFFSVYIFGFGIIGLLVYSSIMGFAFIKASRSLWPVMICSLLGNSVMLSSIVMFMYISAFILTAKHEQELLVTSTV